MTRFIVRTCAALTMICGCGWAAEAAKYLSHPPMRPLPTASDRPMGKGPAWFVDAARGNDANPGTEAAPWKTVQRGVKDLNPGDTLCLRGGTYYERVKVTIKGTAEKPITIRAYPKELAILDGGIREFYESPETAWEPCPDGAPGEFQSVKGYPFLTARKDTTSAMGNFGDSMVPLHGTARLGDLRSDNPYWNIEEKTKGKEFIYCGPGVHLNPNTMRFHVRITHVGLPGLGEDRYQGETDPRKLRLVVAGYQKESVLSIEASAHVRVEDLVVRGSVAPTVRVGDSDDIAFDGCAMYGGAHVMSVQYTHGFRATNCAFRGVAAPWTFRAHLKYRAIEARLFSASGWVPQGNKDFELAYCEFTDSIDGVFIGNVDGVKFHHNLLDNCSDDGLFVTATTDFAGETPGGPIYIVQNHISRCLTSFAFGVGHGRQKYTEEGRQLGDGIWVTRNVFDLRPWVGYHMPKGPDEPQELTSRGRSCGDHGSPAWEPMYIYHNTLITQEPAFRNYYANGWGSAMADTRRRVFNNIVVQVEKVPGAVLSPAWTDLEIDGNLHWGAQAGMEGKSEFESNLKRAIAAAERAPKPPRKQPEQAAQPVKPGQAPAAALAPKPASQPPPPPPADRRPWAANDIYADPMFVKFTADWREPDDYRLQPGSPAIDAGVDVPSDWPDPLRDKDAGKPDIGALPLGVEPWRIGVRGRLSVFQGRP